ncbi:hypothetical protein EI427_16855 [Flammeovirga pectinis]|uniref:Uncharacterized protein n=1 Tax=Flammeovirga pectinis TaxID=2494373 RepID=A0A3S9P6J2_9BACT|nr:hypothetical protein [Flammeovirga pectinis]AZQ63835.1 hypothetical protein EI427_16855 [Flammeovirga pectinis]
MKKFNYIYLLLGFFATMFISCEKDLDQIPDDQKARAISWALSEEHKDTLEISIDDYISFMDVSQGLLFHEWTIEDSSSFLSGDFSKNDLDLTPFIDAGKGKKSEDLTVHVYFPEAGIHKVRLYNTFDKKVIHNGLNHKMEAVPHATNPGIWVIDTAFHVEVYADVEPALYVLKNNIDTVLVVPHSQIVDGNDDSDWPTVDLIAGEDVLTFVDTTSVGKPTDTEWTLSYLDTISKNRIFEVTPAKTGTGRAGALKSIRQGSTQALSQNVQKTIPLKLNIVAPEIRPQYEVYKGDDLLFAYNDGDDIPSDNSKWESISLKINETLRFVDNTERGLANARTWKLLNSEFGEYTDEAADVVYSSVQMPFEAGTIVVQRSGVAGVPDENKEIKIPLMINVDEALLKTSAIQQLPSRLVSFETSVAVGNILSSAAGEFTVNITNPNGYASTASISNVAIDAASNNVINLTIAETTYNSDQITISYAGTGGITTSTGMGMEAFEAENVVMDITSVNEFENADMISVEIEAAGLGNAFADGWYQDGGQDSEIKKWARSTDFASDRTASMSYKSDDRTVQASTLFSIHNEHTGKDWNNGMKNPAGDYLFTFDIYIPEGVDFTGGLITGFQDTSLPNGDKIDYTPNISAVAKGQWVTITQIVSFDLAGGRRQLVLKVIDPVPSTGALEFYVDNFNCKAIEARP